MIGKVLLGTAAAAMSIGLAAPAGAVPQDFLAAVRAAGITGADPAMLADGYDVCSALWNAASAPGTDDITTVSAVTPDQRTLLGRLAAGFVRDHPQLTTDQAAHFVLAAYSDLCPVPGSYDYWAYSTS
ncbi:MAG: DUF732 domain-containing protein [Mycobacterium sp.]